MNLFDKVLPLDRTKRKWTVVGLTNLFAGLLTLVNIYVFKEYGIALFILTPFLIGFGSTVLYGYDRKISRLNAFGIGFLTLTVFSLLLLIFAIEGVICIAMAAPFAIVLTWVGCLVGVVAMKKNQKNSTTLMLVLIGVIPSVAFVEKEIEPKLISVKTSIEINATPQTVWENVVEFPQLTEPTELLFQVGVAYPINARIDGSGVGAVRYCNFTTGSFVEPITVWNQPKLLKFSVLEQPAPIKELSFWNVDAPHLHDYFVSKQGQFKLIALSNGKTRLEGTTWYYHNIKPAFYWQLWSNQIVHQIHKRVLTHIKFNSEREEKNGI